MNQRQRLVLCGIASILCASCGDSSDPFVLFGWGCIWFMSAVAVGAVAGRWGHSGVGYFFCALVFSPVFMGLFLVAVGEDGIRCARCGTRLPRAAVVCSRCGYAGFQPPAWSPPAYQAPPPLAVLAPAPMRGDAPVPSAPVVPGARVPLDGYRIAAFAVAGVVVAVSVTTVLVWALSDPAPSARPVARPAAKPAPAPRHK